MLRGRDGEDEKTDRFGVILAVIVVMALRGCPRVQRAKRGHSIRLANGRHNQHCKDNWSITLSPYNGAALFTGITSDCEVQGSP